MLTITDQRFARGPSSLGRRDFLRIGSQRFVDRHASSAASGKKDSVQLRMIDDTNSTITSPLDHVDDARWQVRFLPKLHHVLGDGGGLFARFENDRVARQNRWHDVTIGQVSR